MNRLKQSIQQIMRRPPGKKTHDALGWTLTVLLTIAGLLVLPANLITSLPCFSMAIAVCPKVKGPAWVRVLIILINLGFMT